MKVHLGPYPKNRSKERKLSVRIDPYDVWGLDHTLALIIHPALILLKEKKQGAPNVDDDDVPEGIRSTNDLTPKENEYDLDAFFFKRWDWVMDEMIWTFDQIKKDDDTSQFFVYEEPRPKPTSLHDKFLETFDIDDEFFYDSYFDFITNEFIIISNVPNEPEEPPKKLKTPIFLRKEYEAHDERINNGLRLFGKYFRALWD